MTLPFFIFPSTPSAHRLSVTLPDDTMFSPIDIILILSAILQLLTRNSVVAISTSEFTSSIFSMQGASTVVVKSTLQSVTVASTPSGTSFWDASVSSSTNSPSHRNTAGFTSSATTISTNSQKLGSTIKAFTPDNDQSVAPAPPAPLGSSKHLNTLPSISFPAQSLTSKTTRSEPEILNAFEASESIPELPKPVSSSAVHEIFNRNAQAAFPSIIPSSIASTVANPLANSIATASQSCCGGFVPGSTYYYAPGVFEANCDTTYSSSNLQQLGGLTFVQCTQRCANNRICTAALYTASQTCILASTTGASAYGRGYCAMNKIGTIKKLSSKISTTSRPSVLPPIPTPRPLVTSRSSQRSVSTAVPTFLRSSSIPSRPSPQVSSPFPCITNDPSKLQFFEFGALSGPGIAGQCENDGYDALNEEAELPTIASTSEPSQILSPQQEPDIASGNPPDFELSGQPPQQAQEALDYENDDVPFIFSTDSIEDRGRIAYWDIGGDAPQVSRNSKYKDGYDGEDLRPVYVDDGKPSFRNSTFYIKADITDDEINGDEFLEEAEPVVDVDVTVTTTIHRTLATVTVTMSPAWYTPKPVTLDRGNENDTKTLDDVPVSGKDGSVDKWLRSWLSADHKSRGKVRKILRG